MEEITITRPDDCHVHLRDGEMLKMVAPYTARVFGRAIVMPNLSPSVDSLWSIVNYKQRILEATKGYNFTPWMTLMLTKNLKPFEIWRCRNEIKGVKLMMSGVSTGAENTIEDIEDAYPVLEKMSELDIPLLVHAEMSGEDPFDAETMSIDYVLGNIVREFPDLRIVFEHVTTKHGVQWVEDHENVSATITVHHMLYNRADLLNDVRLIHKLWCKPIFKTEIDRLHLVAAATSGNPKFFLGTDSAPHLIYSGQPGIFTAESAMEICTQIFDEEKMLKNLELFASINGASFYREEKNKEKITLVKRKRTVPFYITDDVKTIQPLMAEQEIKWSIL